MFVSKYKAVIFDFDETLVKSYSVKWAQHQATAKKFYNVNLTEDTIRKYWGMPYTKFDLIQGSTDSEFHKPDPRVFDGLISQLVRLNIKKEEALYVGDDIRDLEAARGAGLGFAAISNGLTTRKEFEDQRAICLNSLSDLIR